MIALTLGALRSRGAQTMTVLILAVLAVGAAAAAPWYVLAAGNASLLNAVRGAAPVQRTLNASRGLTLAPDAQTSLSALGASVRAEFDAPGAVSYLGLYQMGRYQAPGVDLSVPVAYRDQVCQHVTLAGDCPRAPGEALLSRRSADVLGVRIGDTITTAPGTGSATLHIVGLYDRADPGGLYWSDSLFGPPSPAQAAGRTDPVFVTPPTFVHGGFDQPTGVDDVLLPEDAFRDPGLGPRLDRAQFALSQQNLKVYQSAGLVLDRIARERQLIDVGVLVGAAQLLSLCWFALYLAGRSTGPDRRLDVALLKLRGAGFGRLLRLTVAHTAAPILAGLPPGVALGYLTARSLAGPLDDPGRVRLAWQLSTGAVLVAVLGAVLAIVVAEWRMLRAPVAELLRRVPPRHAGWRADAVSLAMVALAAAGAYQVRAQGGVDGSVPGLALLAPGLVALALAVLLARALTYAAGRLGTAALHAGRVRLSLAALQVARRPGTDRVFVLLAIAVAVLGAAAGSWQASTTARNARALTEVGADRVLTVQADSRIQLLDAVRAADPTGRQAMAVVYNAARVEDAPPVLAVDAPRLAAVAAWQPGYGVDPAALAALLRPAGPDPLLVRGGTATLDATVLEASQPVELLMELADTGTGGRSQVAFGPLGAGRQTYRAATPSCVDGDCRLVSLRLVRPPASLVATTGGGKGVIPAAFSDAAPGTSVAVHGIDGAAPDPRAADAQSAGPTALGDVRRWRGAFAASASNPVLRASAGQLTLTVPAPGPPLGGRPDGRVYALDLPLPLPAVLAGPAPGGWQAGEGQLAPFGSDAAPVRIVGTAAALPLVGNAGVLVDLETTDRAVGPETIGDVLQVWLAPGASPSIVDHLRSAGLAVLGTDSVAADRARWGTAGTTAALRFNLLTSLVALLLAAVALVVSAVAERGPRGAELVALRRQGLAGAAARGIGYGGYAALAGIAVLAGLLGTVLARLVAGPGLTVFAEPWTVLPMPAGLCPLPLLSVGAAAVVLLGTAAAGAGAQLARAIRDGGGR